MTITSSIFYIIRKKSTGTTGIWTKSGRLNRNSFNRAIHRRQTNNLKDMSEVWVDTKTWIDHHKPEFPDNQSPLHQTREDDVQAGSFRKLGKGTN